ncbi:hypothetical protein FHR20_001173 [Sphingomonas leidyi]|uniref:Uncharacterized protein n=1 Tax=Sphingomonas leidyi TaxID=68569 RepID=A0A7X5ZUM8_9SPHN|nr:hypothetical protein [Sphingomonas leidyi]NIJ64242.1 hypothetical protein [Sphingomonas leidyi]
MLGAIDPDIRSRLCATPASLGVVVELLQGDPVKALVVGYFARFVAEGTAAWDVLGNGDIEIRFCTGETYVLAEAGVLRLS